MHSHHSHSGQYVAHANDSLECMVERAEANGFTHFCLTEHMPRLDSRFLYPEEIELEFTVNTLAETFDDYINHAVSLQDQYNFKKPMKLLVGFEIEGIDESHINYAKQLIHNSKINMTVGSVHFVNLIPIDFNSELWLRARDSTREKTSRGLYKEYFQIQYQVISQLKPTVIGHFDLIRLQEPIDEIDPTTNKKLGDIDIRQDWPDVWELACRNIKYAIDYGALFELNSSAIRKGWETPYPKRDFATIIDQFGGKFCLSDDSHGTTQVGLNFQKVLEYAISLNLKNLYYLDLDETKTLLVKSISISELRQSKFWKQYQ